MLLSNDIWLAWFLCSCKDLFAQQSSGKALDMFNISKQVSQSDDFSVDLLGSLVIPTQVKSKGAFILRGKVL